MAIQTTGDITGDLRQQPRPKTTSDWSQQEAQKGLRMQADSQSPTYKLSDDQYSQLGQDAWKLGNSNDFYSKGWLNLGDYGGSDKYQFAYDDAQNIGQADQGDTSRYLYVRQASDPNNYQRYSLGDATDPNINMADLGKQLYAGGNNLLNDFWTNSYGWQPPQYDYTPNPPAQVTPPNSPYPDQGGVKQPDGSYRVPGPGQATPIDPEDAINIGMGGATQAYQNLLDQPQYYPGWWGQDYQTMDASKYMDQYPTFLDVPEYQGITMPGPYQGLMEGDYDRLETALRTPGEIAAKNAFDQGGNYLKDVMGGNGMYGSSIMAQQANEGLNRPYMDTLATNAANAVTQRYGLQQGDLQFGANYGLNLADLQQQDLMNKYTADMTGRNLRSDYDTQKFQLGYGLDEAQRGEYNNLLQNRFQYDLASQDWRNALNERYMNSGLALAGKGAPLQAANRQYELSQDAYNNSQLGSSIGMGIDIIDRMGGLDWAGNQIGSIFDSFFKKKG